MTGPNPKRQKAAWAVLDQLFANAANYWIVHYSCESFYNRPEGRSPRITSIAARKIDTGQTLSFSIHQVAERKRIPFAEIEHHYDSLERGIPKVTRSKPVGVIAILHPMEGKFPPPPRAERGLCARL
jgi:hypothetical protein